MGAGWVGRAWDGEIRRNERNNGGNTSVSSMAFSATLLSNGEAPYSIIALPCMRRASMVVLDSSAFENRVEKR